MRSRKNRFYTKEPTLNDFPVSVETKTRKPRLVSLLALVIIILIALFLALTKFSGLQTKQKPSVTPTQMPSPTDTVVPSPQASVSATVTPKISLTPTGKESATVDKATGLDRAALTVAIQNGSGVVGAAGKIAASLKTLGYQVGATGNAATFDYTNITIQVKATATKYLPLLQKDLSSTYTIGKATKDLPATSSEDALIIVGK